MGYDKKYQDALNGISTLLKEGEEKGLTITAYRRELEEIFPELRESEDEKIRKELIDIVKKSPITFAFKDKWKVLAWLEKQVQKPQGKSALEASKEEKVDNANKVEPKDYSGIDPHFFKPAWSEEDKEMLEDTCRILSNSKECTTSNVRWLKSLRPKNTRKLSYSNR